MVDLTANRAEKLIEEHARKLDAAIERAEREKLAASSHQPNASSPVSPPPPPPPTPPSRATDCPGNGEHSQGVSAPLSDTHHCTDGMCTPLNPCHCYDQPMNEQWEAIEELVSNVESVRK